MAKTTTILCATILGGSLLAACGGGSDEDESRRGRRNTTAGRNSPTDANPDATSANPANPGTIDPALAGTLQGVVRFDGTAPRRREIPLSGNPECGAMHTEPLLVETVIVNDNGTLRNVFVYIKSGLPRTTYAAPTEPVVMEQHGCTYIPHVFGVRVGQTVRIRNGDAILHNVHMRSQRNGEWNFSQVNQGQVDEQSFRIPEIMAEFSCDVHSWMKCYAGVVSHPFFAVTGDDGAYAIPDVPPGSYVLEAWHERFGAVEHEIVVTEGGSIQSDFTFSEAGGQ